MALTLSLVFRIMAANLFLWGLGMAVAPATMVETMGFEATAGLFTMMQFMATMMLVFGVIHWQMPIWAGDNLKTVGMTFVIIHSVFLLLNLYQMASGSIPINAMQIGGQVPQVILIVLFFLKSR